MEAMRSQRWTRDPHRFCMTATASYRKRCAGATRQWRCVSASQQEHAAGQDLSTFLNRLSRMQQPNSRHQLIVYYNLCSHRLTGHHRISMFARTHPGTTSTKAIEFTDNSLIKRSPKTVDGFQCHRTFIKKSPKSCRGFPAHGGGGGLARRLERQGKVLMGLTQC